MVAVLLQEILDDDLLLLLLSPLVEEAQHVQHDAPTTALVVLVVDRRVHSVGMEHACVNLCNESTSESFSNDEVVMVDTGD